MAWSVSDVLVGSIVSLLLISTGLWSLLDLVLDLACLITVLHLRSNVNWARLLFRRLRRSLGSIDLRVNALCPLARARPVPALSLVVSSLLLVGRSCLLLQEHLLLDLVLVHLLGGSQVEVVNYVGDVGHAVRI